MALLDTELGPIARGLITEFGRTLVYTKSATGYNAASGESTPTTTTTFSLTTTGFFEDTEDLNPVDMSVARSATAFCHDIFAASGAAGSASIPGIVSFVEPVTGRTWLVTRAQRITIVDTSPICQIWVDRA